MNFIDLQHFRTYNSRWSNLPLMGTKTKSTTPLKDEKTWHTIGNQPPSPLSLNEAVMENAQVGERGKINKLKENYHVLPDLNKKGNVA